MNKTLLAVLALALAGAAVLAFNPPEPLLGLMAKTDVVAIHAKRSYAAMLASLPGESRAKQADGGWMFSAPDGSAEFFWNSSAARLRTPAAPFLEAGLNPALLPEGMLRDGMLASRVGADAGGRQGESPVAAFDGVVDSCRESVGYHFQFGHFGLELDGGALLEWAGDPSENTLDLVFALDPAALLRAGAAPDQVAGWSLGTITVHEPGGRKAEVPKLLKPFDLQ